MDLPRAVLPEPNGRSSDPTVWHIVRVDVAFLMTAYNERPWSLDRTAEAVLAQTRAGRLLVVDDASDVPVAIDGVEVYRVEQNLGISAARNVGLARLAGYDLIGILNCDVLLDPTWAEVTAQHLLANPSLGAAWTPLRHHLDSPTTRWWIDCQEQPSAQLTPVDIAPGHAVMFRRDALAAVSGYDAVNFRGIGEDNDICQRMRVAGFETEALSAPFNRSLQDTSLRELARKDIFRLYLSDMPRHRQAVGVISKAARRTLRHVREGKFGLVPLDWAVAGRAMLLALLGR